MPATFSVTRDQIIDAAMRLCGVLGQYNTPTANDYTVCAEALNMLVKQWQIEGMPLWQYQKITVPLVAAQASYTIGPTGNVVVDRPLRVAQAYIRDANGTDTPLMQVSRQEYNGFTIKTQEGVPHSVYFDPQLTNAVLYVYPVPEDATRTIYIECHSPVQDFTASGTVPDFPSEWFQALKFGLADAIAFEFDVPIEKQQIFERKALMFKEQLTNWSQEEASVFFGAA